MEQIPNLSNQYGNLFQGYASYGNTPAPNSPGTMAMPALNQVQGNGSNFWNTLDSLINGSSPYASLINGGISMIGNLLNRGYEAKQAQKQRDWNEAMVDKQNQFSLDMWNRTNEYNSPAEQIKRMQEAGLNPLYYGLDGSSANAFESAQPLGYDRASVKGVANPLQAGLDQIMQKKQLDLLDANITKTKSETDSTTLDNEFKKKTMQARVEATDLANTATKEQIAKVKDERKQIAENIKKTIAETENEFAKKMLIEAQTRVQNAQADEIIKLLPYRQLLLEAQTEAQRASASLNLVKAAVENKLLGDGYYDLMIETADQEARKAGYDADTAEFLRELQRYKNDLKNGTFFDETSHGWILNKEAHIINSFIAGASLFSEILVGPVAGIFGAK